MYIICLHVYVYKHILSIHRAGDTAAAWSCPWGACFFSAGLHIPMPVPIHQTTVSMNYLLYIIFKHT